MTIRYLLKFDADWQIEVLRSLGQGVLQLGQRSLQRLPVPTVPGCFVPAAPGANPTSAAVLADLTSRLARRDFRRNAVRETGQCLFDAVLGQMLWDMLVADAQSGGAELMELALQWPAGDTDLHRLNWELMHSGKAFLAEGVLDSAGRRLRVAISRRVGGAALIGRPLSVPTRFLFVVGCSLDDAEVSPGSEYLALMRHLERTPFARQPEVRLLAKATPARLKAAVGEFHPDVVHIVSHGRIEKNEVVLDFQPDPDPKAGSPVLNGQRLAEVLRRSDAGHDVLPPLVVLSACYSGAVDDFNTVPATSSQGTCLPSAPLAAQLVSEGVPIVIGMGGRVTDRACRLFTQFFCAAILWGRELVDSLERGRRGAFFKGEDPERAHDWSLPTLFLAEGVAQNFRPTPEFVTGEIHPVNKALSSLGLQPQITEPVLAARFDCLEEKYTALFNEKPVLVLLGESGSGKSRLLKELAARAVRAGHVPFFLDGKVFQQPITSPALLRKGLLGAYQASGKAFGFHWEEPAQMRLLPEDGFLTDLPAGLDLEVKVILEEDHELSPRVLRESLLKDLRRFMKELRDQWLKRADAPSGPFQPGGRPVVFLGHLEFLPQSFVERLLSPTVLTDCGLGEPGFPVPVVVSLENARLGGQLAKVLMEKQAPAAWFDIAVLDPLQSEEAVHAIERVLLHPHNPTIHDCARYPWVLDHGAPEFAERREYLLKDYWVPSLPNWFMTRFIYVWVKESVARGVIHKASDNEIMQELEK